MSSHMFAKFEWFKRACFNADQTMDICSQQPGTFSIQPFWIEVLINLLLEIMWDSNRLEMRLKNNLPSTLTRAIGRKSLILDGFGNLVLGINISFAYRHWIGMTELRIQEVNMRKRKVFIWGHFLYTL